MTGVRLADLVTETGADKVQVGGSAISITYRVLWDAQITQDEWKSFETMPIRDYYKLMLPRILLSWDLTGADDQAIPITAAAFDEHQMPNRLLGAITVAITGSAVAGKGTSSNSPAT